MIRKIILAAGLALLFTVPVAAQTPTPSTPTNASVVRDVAEAAQTLGVLNVVLLFVVGILALIVVFFVIAAYRLGVPLVQAAQKANQARDELQEQLMRRIEADDEKDRSSTRLRIQSAETQQKAAAAQERIVGILDDIETRKEANDGRTQAINAINQHTDDAMKPIDHKLSEVAKTLEDLRVTVVTKQILDATIVPLVERIDRALSYIHDLQPPCEPDAPAATHDDPPADASSTTLTPGVPTS